MPSLARTPPTLTTLILITGASVLSLNMFLPSLVSIAAEFDAPYGLVSLSIGGYLAATALVQVIIGPLSDRYGRRPVLLVTMAVFLLASLGCLMAHSIELFLAFRMGQAAVIAGGTLSRVIVRDVEVEPRAAAAKLATIGMAMALAPMLGPTLGGLLEQAFGWRASFAAFSVIGAALLVLVWVDLGETNARPSVSFASQFGAYPELARSAAFWAYSACVALSTGGFFVFLAGAPLVAVAQFGVSPGWLGIYIGSITGGFLVGSALSARVFRARPIVQVMLWGRIVPCAGLALGLGLFALGHAHEAVLFGATICVGLGNGLTLPGANLGVMSVRPELAGTASGLAGALNLAAGAVLTAFAGLVVGLGAGAIGLLALMLVVVAGSLASVLWIMRIEGR